jgi:outer membrane receptor protein involved in Fe transport
MRPLVRHRTHRLSLIALTIMFAACASLTYAADALSQTADFSIEPQEVETALHEWSRQADVQVMVGSTEVAGQRTNGVRGRLSAANALSRLLRNTGLTYELAGGNTVTVKRIAAAQTQQEVSLEDSPSQNEINATTSNAREFDTDRQRPRNVLEEIVVSAQKREQQLIDVPISISAISGDNLARDHINDMQDLSFSVPSMSTAEIGSGRQLITIRGLGGFGRGNTSLTGVYLDEMPLSGLQDGFLATYIDMGTTDLERVEVLKGPQGTLFGEGSVGGTVRLITKEPDLTGLGGMLSASLFSNSDSNDWSQELRGVLNVPILEDKLGLRIAATYDNEAGWIDRLQTVNGPVIEEDFNDSEVADVRIKTLWRPTDKLGVTVMVAVHRGEGGGSNIVNTGDREDSEFIVEFEPTAPTGFEDNYELYNLTARYDVGFAEVLSSTSYSETDSVAALLQRKPLIPNPAPGFQEVFQRDYALDASAFSQELRIASQGSSSLNWTLGAFYKDSELASRFNSGIDFFRYGMRAAPVGFQSNSKPNQTSKSWAAFVDVSYKLGSRFELGGGVRYFEDDREIIDLLAANPGATFLSGKFDATTFRTYLSYAVTDNLKLYGNVSTGFRSGGFNAPPSVAAGGPPTFKPEEVTSYELGTKMALADKRVDLRAALFYSEYTDIQMNSIFFDRNGAVRAYTLNPGEAEIIGVEVEFNWAATDRLTFGINGDVTDTEITKITDPLQTAFVVGDPIDLVPEHSQSAWVNYDVNWSQAILGYIRLQYTEQGETTTTLRSLGALEPITHTSTLNFLSASLVASWNDWEFELFARNLLDEAGALRTGGGIDPQARPRMIGIKFGKSFGS